MCFVNDVSGNSQLLFFFQSIKGLFLYRACVCVCVCVCKRRIYGEGTEENIGPKRVEMMEG
jgi:hypothetical protein